MIDEHGGAEAVDDDVAVAQSKEIGDGVVYVKLVGFFFFNAAPGVFGNTLAFTNRRSGVTTGGMDG